MKTQYVSEILFCLIVSFSLRIKAEFTADQSMIRSHGSVVSAKWGLIAGRLDMGSEDQRPWHSLKDIAQTTADIRPGNTR